MKNMMIHTKSKHIATVLRYAALVVMMMCMGVNGAWGQHPFTLTTAEDITNGTQKYYLIQAIDRPTFYAIPHSNSDGAKVSTTSIPNANMRWCFVDAGSDSDHQYYYIVNSTGRCLYRNSDSNDGILIKKTYTELSSLSDDELTKYKFFLTQTGLNYFIQPKGFSGQYLNKRGGQVNYANGYYIKSSTFNDSPSVWNFVAVGSVTWPQPFTVSTNAEKHYYKFQNVNNTSFYLSNSGEWATVSSEGNDEDIWYFLEAGVDATYSNCHYYYIVNAATSKYLYHTGGTGNDVAKVMDYNSEEDDKYRFLIVDGAYKSDNTNYSTCYTIVPKLRQTYFYDKDSYAPMAMSDDSHLLLKSDRSVSGYDTHWVFEVTDYVVLEAPTITNNFNGTISLSTATAGATIYYTTNGDTPDNTSTEYSSAFSLGNATVIKAIAYLGSVFSDVTTYNVPQYGTPTISFNSATQKVTITGGGTIYYTTGGSTPTTSSTTYTAPFTVSSGATIKAIATNAGYLTSEVAELTITKVATPTIQDNGSNAVSITCATEGATIHYTTDGSTPTTSSTQYTGPLTENVSGVTIKAIAVKENMINSEVGSGTVTLQYGTPPIISFNSATQMVTITGSGTIYYTTGGGTPTTSSTAYSAPFNVASATTVKAIATQAGYNPSTVTTLTIAQVATPTIQDNGSNAVSITCATDGATIHYTTDGSTPTTSSNEYTGPLTENVSGVTVKAIAVKADMINSAVGSGSVTLQCATPVITRDGMTFSISCNMPTDATVYYSLNGSTPSTSYSGPVSFTSDQLPMTVTAVAKHANYTDSESATFELTNGAGTPSNPYRIYGQTGFADFISDVNAGTTSSACYKLETDISASGLSAITTAFTGTFDGGMQTITGLTHALFNTISSGTVKNVMLKDVNISNGTNVGAIANEVIGTSSDIASIYNCGILPSENGSSISGSGSVGSLVGLLGSTSDDNNCYARVINCFSFATVSGGANTGGIVGNNTYASKSSDIEGGSIRTMVMNCMFYGTGSNIYPIYGGQKISNEATDGRLNNYNYFSYEKLPSANITAYNNALAAEDRYLKRFEFYRYLLNSTRELAAWYATGSTADAHTKMAKWVLDKEIAEYPILKVQDSNTSGTYPSVVNYDPDYTFNEGTKVARASVTERNKGKNLGTLTVNISVGSGHPADAAIKPGKSQITLQRTDKDYEDYKFNYDKVQLPYYNEVGTKNCTGNKVVTGWKITAMEGGTQGTFTASDTWDGYNFADRTTYAKDIYSVSGRVFSQGAYFDVPDSVTSITIEPYWGNAAYLSDATYDCYGSYNKDLFGTNKGGISPLGVTDFGTRYTGGSTYSICGDNQAVYTDFASALGTLSGSSVYDNAIVLVGNYHQVGPPSTGTKPFTIMSVDQNDDNEPDYCFIINSGKQQDFSPVRFDFVSVPGTTMAHKITSTTFMGILGNHKWKGWLETTSTTLIRFSQLEYDSEKKSGSQPVILLGGIVEQMVSTNGSEGATTHTKYIHVGGNVWFKIFNNGCHIDKTKTSTPHIPISVTGGDFEKFYLSGYFQPNAPKRTNDNAECYISGGRFVELAGAGQEQIDGNVTWLIDRADITDFYGGGINDKKPITGNISITIRNSYVDQYCGGPKFGNMTETKTVVTTATNCHFDNYFGAGYGGTSLLRYTPSDNTHNKYDKLNYPWDTWLSDANGYTRGQYDSEKGIAVSYEYEQFEGSNDKTVGRLYINYASLSVAQTNNVTSSLTGCTITGNFYGGGSFGKVNGDVTSTLTNCSVTGSVFGAGFSATAPKAEVFPQENMNPNPNYNTNTGVLEEGGYPTAVEYTWSNTKGASDNANSLVDDNDDDGDGDDVGHWIHTDVDLTTLGTVTGKVTLNIEGTTTVTGNVYGGGESSNTKSDVEVNINGGTLHDVYGGGYGRLTNVSGDVTVNIGKSDSIAGANIYGDVYGGSALGSVNTAYNASTHATYDKTTVNLNVGTIDGNVYGGGLGNDTIPAYVYGNVEVYLFGAILIARYENDPQIIGLRLPSSGMIFGCNNVNGTPKGHVKVVVYKTTGITGVQERSSLANRNTDNENDHTYELAAVYGGGNHAAYDPDSNDSTEVIINGCGDVSIHSVYGGGNAASTPATSVQISGAYEIEFVFGGGNGAGTGNPGANVGYYAYSDNIAGPTQINDRIGYKYGTGFARTNVYGGRIHKIYGGSNTKGNVRQTAVSMLDELSDCELVIDGIYGGGREAYMEGSTALELGCITGMEEIYGGSEKADVGNSVELTITSGHFNKVFGGNNKGGRIFGSITVNIEQTGCVPITIDELYLGGNNAPYSVFGYSEDTVHIVIDGDTVVHHKLLETLTSTRFHDPVLNIRSFDTIGTVYGGGNGELAVMVANPTVDINITKGWVNGEYSGNKINYSDYVNTPDTLDTDGVINTVFGGGNAAKVIGNTTVLIGNRLGDTITLKSMDELYRTIGNEGVQKNKILVEKATVNGEEGITYTPQTGTALSESKIQTVRGATIKGNVYGGGNNANVTGKTKVQIGPPSN